MFEKLLSLLLHAKGGAVATVFVLGTSGALVTATVDAGVTTLTITQPSSTTSGSETTPGGTTTNSTVTEAILALFNRTNGDEDPTATATGKGCSDEAHARNKEMKDVNEASKDNGQEVKALGKDAEKSAEAKELVKDADKEIKDIRRLAVKAIHATFDCDPNEDAEDVDEDENQDEDNTSDTDTSLDFTGNAEAIADLATLLMEQVVAELKAALEGLDESDESTTTTNEKQNGMSDNAKNKNKGKGKGRNSDRD